LRQSRHSAKMQLTAAPSPLYRLSLPQLKSAYGELEVHSRNIGPKRASAASVRQSSGAFEWKVA
jgi:hypothetical protein